MALDQAKAAPASKPLSHPGKRVYILVPADDLSLKRCLDFLEPMILDLPEKDQPTVKVVQELRLGLVGDGKIIYTCVTRTRKSVTKDRKIAVTEEIHLSDPIVCDERFVSDSAEDGLGTVDATALADAIQAVSHPFCARFSADKDMTKKKLKLFST